MHGIEVASPTRTETQTNPLEIATANFRMLSAATLIVTSLGVSMLIACRRCTRRYFAPERDMQLSRELYAEPFTYADFLETSGYTGTQDIEDVRLQLDG